MASRPYTVRVVRQGSVQEIRIFAANDADARLKLSGNAEAILTVRAERVTRLAATPRQRSEVAWWCGELRSLVYSGMTVVEAMETMAVAADAGSRRELVQSSLLQELRAGHPLSSAMSRVSGYPPVLVASVAAAEQSGNLGESLDEYLRYHEMVDRFRRQVTSAAIYPALVTALGVIIIIALLVFVIPRFAAMYAELPSAMLSGATKLVVGLSKFLTTHPLPVFFVLAATGIVVALAHRLGMLVKCGHLIMRRLPWLARQIQHYQLAQLYHALGLMMRGGYPLHEALDVCAKTAIADAIHQRLIDVYDEISRGLPIGQVFYRAGLADAVSSRLLSVGERTGNFHVVLQTISDRHRESFSIFVDRATKIIEPLLLLLVALLIGGIVVVMYMPIFDIAGQVGVGR
ncbi:type II secretion system F family protein [Rubrivivax gelatinosus]|uniref:General secretion pathway protein F n=1 Tax=Rubrivivax gelatinosus TaxID=28068 RepID=A0A4R2M7Z3_RUBGE|nr:type II secretion system F family protein [Rubrivivax gelatinosus]MBK1687796.1 hypothetical protein [Rubrivivax gelatinosus]TCP03419.1 general secretion pathway protein F [Rubrivivax gelatinosus]